MSKKSTIIELVQELAERNSEGKYDEMIFEAQSGEYHDFKNNKYVCGKVELVNKLADFPELSDIRDAVIAGSYDESPDEEDKRKLREELGDGPLADALGL